MRTLEVRTDLALEIREKYEQDNVEISGVRLRESYESDNRIKNTIVDIVNMHGEKKMGRPIGKYITIENVSKEELTKKDEKIIVGIIKEYLLELSQKIKEKKILVVGLGNKEVTPDSLGPLVAKKLNVTRHLKKEYMDIFTEVDNVAALAPGVMGQTGMEVSEIIRAIVNNIDINLVIAIDALASRSIARLNNAIQITNTGIAPGSGVGNNRKQLDEKTLGVPVIALGIPTVVDAMTIVGDILENALSRQGFKQDEIISFNNEIRRESIENMFVTPKNIDELMIKNSSLIARSINEAFAEYNY